MLPLLGAASTVVGGTFATVGLLDLALVLSHHFILSVSPALPGEDGQYIQHFGGHKVLPYFPMALAKARSIPIRVAA